ncbi:quinolinate synthase NadA [Candidatus Uhrbacteria bacterium]|nr:quinolinate synthase NadA [Candidatus Uhrbacteria bacterium]
MVTAHELGAEWYDRFARSATDLYPWRYSLRICRELATQAIEILALLKEKRSTLLVHNYLFPEFHELVRLAAAEGLPAFVGDSLGLSLRARDAGATRVDFASVFFMGATAKLITGDVTRVFVPDTPDVLGCSLVFGTDHAWVDAWKAKHPDGILITYVNSDAALKAKSDFISTSRNTDRIIVEAARRFPGRRMLLLPDKYLGYVMRERAVTLAKEQGVAYDPELVDVYTQPHGGFHASCYVHEAIGADAPERALAEHPDAELMIHPECGCASSCLLKLHAGIIPNDRAYFLSTEGMVEHARRSSRHQFIVATEKGMVYRLRQDLPEKTFIPISVDATCRYMKANTLERLLRSLRGDRIEIVLCDDCCDPQHPVQDDQVVHIPRTTATRAKVAIDRMLEIQ